MKPMVGIPAGLKDLANASLDPGVLSFARYGDDRQQLHQAGRPKANSQKMIRKPSGPPRRLCGEHGRDLVRGAAQPGAGNFANIVRLTFRAGSRPKVRLFYRRFIVIYLKHPICKSTGKQRLARELS
jgi:hypothetical protein